MAILDKLMEKKDLDAYIKLRLEFIDSIIKKELSRLPEKERELVRQRFIGRKVELKKLLNLLNEDKIKDMSKKYFQKINPESDDISVEVDNSEWDNIDSKDDKTA